MDKYDLHLQRLIGDNPNQETLKSRLKAEWVKGTAPLFRFVSPTGTNHHKSPLGGECGCPVMIRVQNSYSNYWVAWTPELTKLIVGDQEIPSDYLDFTPESLRHLAEVWRKIDSIMGW